MDSYRVFALLVAGGIGQRFGSSIPKQFLEIGKIPILAHTLKHFSECEMVSDIVLVLPKDHIQDWKELVIKHQLSIPHHLCEGGETRFSSVQKGLNLIKQLPSFLDKTCENNQIIAVHDGIRMFVDPPFLKFCFEQAFLHQSFVPCIKVKESLRKIHSTKASEAIDRDSIRLIQTPQSFKADILLKAYEKTYQEYYTDDASVVEDSGEDIYLGEGLANNIKITNEEDRLLAEFLWEQYQNGKL